MRNEVGFTLLELLIVVAILAILMSLAVPSMTTTMERNRVKAATEELYSQVKWARSEAIKRRGPMFVSFNTGAAWCYGFSVAGACDCSVVNSCLIDGGQDKSRQGSEFSNVSLASTFPALGAAKGFMFDRDGVPDAAGSVTTTAGAVTGSITMNIVGNVTLTLP